MIVLLLLVVVACVIGYSMYTRVVRTRNRAESALASIDVQLKKRRDLIPNVLVLAKETMTREVELIERVTELRASAEAAATGEAGAVEEHLQAERALDGGMRQIFAVAEGYPEPRFVEAMKSAQASYEEVEGHIAAARRFYNSSVEELKNVVEIWPSSAIAGWVGVRPMPFFEVEEQDREPVNAADVFSA